MRMGDGKCFTMGELQSLYRSPNIVKVIKCRSAFKILTAKPTGKNPLGRSSRRWEGNIRMDFKEIVFKTRNWINLAQSRDYLSTFVNAIMNLQVT